MSDTITTTRRVDAHERDTMTSAEYRAQFGTPKRSKYGNKRTQTSDGKWFDSRAEAARYEELLWLMREGQISDLECQPVLELQPRFTYEGHRIQPITYRADFGYMERGRRVIEDVKGARTSTFNLKWKMAKYKYPDVIFRLEMV